MCGILALLTRHLIDEDDLKKLSNFVDCRGPDYSSPLHEYSTKCGLQLMMKSSILHLRGDILQKQPAQDEQGNLLQFNGQIYEFEGKPIQRDLSDTTYLIERLKLCNTRLEITQVFAAINGPYAFVYWHNDLNSLFYGRDIFGRRSLCALVGCEAFQPVLISSTATHDLATMDLRWVEISCDGIHCINFNCNEETKTSTYLWNIDSIYPRTAKCKSPDSIRNSELMILDSLPLHPLNMDIRAGEEFDESERISALDEIERRLLKSVETRVKYNRISCLKCRKARKVTPCDHSKVAVAFSGGIDSTLLALALDKVLNVSHTIDLITVAFKIASPDRNSVGSAYRELRKLKPSRNWRLVLCDISLEELQLERTRQISDLILPCQTVIDDSLGCACWFISRAKGRALDNEVEDCWLDANFEEFLSFNPSQSNGADEKLAASYTSPASMIFVGSSIDEQLGGYSSHRAAWNQAGSKGLIEEISFLMRRLSSRNLGRDDRVYSHHGRDVKLPYLDENFVSYLNQLPVGLKMDLNIANDIGPKKLLRELAFRWGLHETGRRVKRALQFGTRIANLESFKEKGSETCYRLLPTTNKQSTAGSNS